MTGEIRRSKPKEAKPRGKSKVAARGKRYGIEVMDEFLARLLDSGGRSMRQVCEDEDMPTFQAVCMWIRTRPDFMEKYQATRVVQTAHMFEDLIAIADDVSNDWENDAAGNPRVNNEAVQRSRLRIDARKWVLSKILPEKYGEKLEVQVNHKISLVDAIAEARERALESSVVEGEFEVLPNPPPRIGDPDKRKGGTVATSAAVEEGRKEETWPDTWEGAPRRGST